MNPDALREFHVTVRDMDVWSFDKAMRAMFGPEKGIEQMWAEYQQFFAEPGAAGLTPAWQDIRKRGSMEPRFYMV